jgi:hypothetical protein
MWGSCQPGSRGGTGGCGRVAAMIFVASALRRNASKPDAVVSGCENSGVLCGPSHGSKPGSGVAKGSLIVDVVGRGIVGTGWKIDAPALRFTLR